MTSVDMKIVSKDKLNLILDNYGTFREKKLITFVNPFSYYKVADFVEAIDYVFVDGCLLQRLHNIFNVNHKVRRASFDFSSIADDVFTFCSNTAIPITLIGSSAAELNATIANLSKLYPGVDFSINLHGYFSEGEFDDLIKKINDNCAQSRVVVCGMGTPKQEELIIKLSMKVTEKNLLYFTCGGFITQTSIKTDYYHPLVKFFGVRWLQRAIFFPHVRRRLVNDYPRFVLRYIAEHMGWHICF